MASFRKALDRIDVASGHVESPALVLQFYGVGGIGKSRLLREFRRVLGDLHPTAIVADLDFDDSSITDPTRALLRLRHTAATAAKLDFKVFDLAYAVYFAKRNPDFSFQKRGLPFQEEAGIVCGVLAAFDGLGLLGVAANIADQIHRYITKYSLHGDAKEALEALKYMSEREIAEALPDFLAFDLNLNRKGNSPLVLFIDTYETLWERSNTENDRLGRDAWVRRLVSGLQSALVVIAGREKLIWSEYEPAWAEWVESHLLHQLSTPDVHRFLRSSGMTDESLIDKITVLADGHPYYLDLCLDAIAQESASSFQNWPDSRRELFERFAKSLSAEELALLKRLAPLASYDKEYARAATRFFHIGLNDDEIDAHERFSFVKRHERHSTIHEIMRRSLLGQIPEDMLFQIRGFALNHFSDRLKVLRFDSGDHEIVFPFRECVRQLRELADPAAVEAWLAESGRHAIVLLQQRAATGPLLESLEALLHVVAPSAWPRDIQTAYADMTHLVGHYADAVNMLDTQLSGVTSTTDDPEVAFALVRRLHHSMMIRSVVDVWREAEIVLASIDKNRCAKAYVEAMFLLGGNLGATIGIPSKAWPWLLSALRQAKRNEDGAMQVRIYRKASDLYRMSGQLVRARSLLEKAIGLGLELHLPRYLNYLECTMVDQFRQEGLREQAFHRLVQVREKIASDNLDGWLGHTYLEEAALHLDAGHIDSALTAHSKARQAYQRTGHLWGNLQCEILLHRANTLSSPEEMTGSANADLALRLENAGYLGDLNNLASVRQGASTPVPAIAFL